MNKLNSDKFDSDDLKERIDEIILKENKNNIKFKELKKETEILKSALERKNNIENE